VATGVEAQRDGALWWVEVERGNVDDLLAEPPIGDDVRNYGTV
jgi:hypothetical protein